MTEDEWSGRMTTLHGRIEEGVLANLLQYLSLSQASGCLLLRHPQSRQGYVYFEHGRIVFIEAKPSYDLAALAALLRWRDGQFSFRPGVRSPRITLERSTEMLLLEAAHMADEVHERRDEGPRVDADTVLSALAEGPVARAHLGNAAARHGHPEPASGETEPMGRAPDGLTEPTTRHRERTAQGERTDPARSDPPVNRERGSRTARNGRSSRSSVRARAYAVMLPEVRTSSSDAAGAASTDEPATERHGDAGPDQSLAHEATAPAHGLAPQTTMPRSRSAIASDAPSETVALSLSALLLYRKLDGLKS